MQGWVVRGDPGRGDQGGGIREEGPGRGENTALAAGGQALQGHFGVTVASDLSLVGSWEGYVLFFSLYFKNTKSNLSPLSLKNQTNFCFLEKENQRPLPSAAGQ